MNQPNARVLIMMSTYNGARYLLDQLMSISIQDDVEKYYLIRDDGSNDNTIELLKQFSLKELNVELIFGNNIGCTNSFKELLILADKYINKVDYYAFSDQDDIWLKDKLSTAINQLEKLPQNKPSMYCSNLMLVDESLNCLGMMRRGKIHFSKGNSLVESIATGCTMVFNPKTIEVFNNSLPRYMRYHDLWIYQMCIFLGEVYYDNNSHILYRQHSNNELGAKYNFASQWKSRFKSFHTLSTQHYREWQAKELITVYDKVLCIEDKKVINIVANYRKSLLHRIRFLFPPKNSNLRMNKFELNFWLKIRILLGFV